MARSIPVNPHALPPLGVRLRQGARRALRRAWRWRWLVLRPHLPGLPRRGMWGVRWRWVALVVVLMGGEWVWLSSGGAPSPAHGTAYHAGDSAPQAGTRRTGTRRTATGGSAPRVAAGGGAPTGRVGPQGNAPGAPAGARWVAVVGAGGDGVYLRRGPRRAQALAIWPEGTELEVVAGAAPRSGGEGKGKGKAEGRAWVRVRDPAGRVGYMSAAYLVAAPAPRRARVAHTGGQGVYLRRTPWRGGRIRAWPEGTPLLAFGTEQDAAGWAWTYVRDPAGNLGWVPARYLDPEDGPLRVGGDTPHR